SAGIDGARGNRTATGAEDHGCGQSVSAADQSDHRAVDFSLGEIGGVVTGTELGDRTSDEHGVTDMHRGRAVGEYKEGLGRTRIRIRLRVLKIESVAANSGHDARNRRHRLAIEWRDVGGALNVMNASGHGGLSDAHTDCATRCLRLSI